MSPPSAAPQRLRGTIETVTPTSVRLQTTDGATETLILSTDTRYTIVATYGPGTSEESVIHSVVVRAR